MGTLTKYLLLQIPGWILAIIVAGALRHGLELPLWVAIGLVVLWVIKDLVMYPLLRTAYESNAKTGVAQLIGARGIAQEELAPRGFVKVRGELWQAEVPAGGRPIAAGSEVRVEGGKGMTLRVRAEKRDRVPLGNQSAAPERDSG